MSNAVYQGVDPIQDPWVHDDLENFAAELAALRTAGTPQVYAATVSRLSQLSRDIYLAIWPPRSASRVQSTKVVDLFRQATSSIEPARGDAVTAKYWDDIETRTGNIMRNLVQEGSA